MLETLHAVFEFLATVFRVSTPLIFAALGGFFAEKSGVTDIALEGKLLLGAFVGAIVAYYSGSPWLGAFTAGMSGVVFACVYALFTVTFKSNQIVTGTALNMMTMGLVPFTLNILFDVSGSSPALERSARFGTEPVWICWLVLGLVTFWLTSLKSGRWLKFAGEHPEALMTAGISVVKTRWYALLAGGFLTGLGGASLSLFLSSSYSRNMSAGRGFMALAALILGNWKPIPTAVACLMFGAVDALQVRLQDLSLKSDIKIPTQFIQILPYILTIIITARFWGRSRAPSALGKS